MADNVILFGCDIERSRSSVKVKNFSIRRLPATLKYTCEVSLKSYYQYFLLSLTEMWPGEERRT